jgi:hypothetical protein
MRHILFGLTILLSYAIASAGELFSERNYQPRVFAMADKLENDATIGGYSIWNGEGKWRLYELIRSEASRGEPLGDVRLFQTENKKFIATMSVYANLAPGSSTWSDEPCKRDDMLFKKQMAGGREDNCVTINHITRFMSNPEGKGIELFAMLKEQGIEFPPTVLQIKITRNGTSSRKLAYTLHVNPEILGFASETEQNWSRSPWNKTMAFNDASKKQFIDGLSNWALAFAKQMDEGIMQKPNAFSNIPSWRAGIEIKAKNNDAKPVTTLD